MKCPDCEGAGYKEYEHGLIRIMCSTCNGTGEFEEPLTFTDESTEMIEVAPGKYEVPDDNTGNARTGKDNKPSRSKDTGKPKQREPRKPGGKATKKTI